MRAMVTGGSGFIGSHVVDKLIEKDIDVRVFDRVKPIFRDDLDWYNASLLDYDAVRTALADVDVVFHLAAVADVKDVFEEPHYSEQINVRATANLLEACRKSSGQRLILGSTTWVYSDAKVNSIDENTPTEFPSHFYSATKLASELYCKSYSTMYEVPTTILRYGIPYGPRARDGAVIPIFVKKAFSGEPITIQGDGLQFRKFVYVEDLAEGNVAAMNSKHNHSIYNLDGEEKVTIKQIAETIQKIIGNVEIKYLPARPGDFAGKEISSEKAKNELNWQPSTSFEDGVNSYINWYKEYKL